MLPPRLCFADLDAISHFLLRVLCCGDGAATHWLLEAEEMNRRLRRSVEWGASERVCLFSCLFVGSFVRSFVRSFVCLFVCLFVLSSIGWLFFYYMIMLKLVTSYSYSTLTWVVCSGFIIWYLSDRFWGNSNTWHSPHVFVCLLVWLDSPQLTGWESICHFDGIDDLKVLQEALMKLRWEEVPKVPNDVFVVPQCMRGMLIASSFFRDVFHGFLRCSDALQCYNREGCRDMTNRW